MRVRVMLLAGAASLLPAALGAQDDELPPVVYALDPAAANAAMAELQSDGGAFDYGAGDGIDAAMISAATGAPKPLAAEFSASAVSGAQSAAKNGEGATPYQQDAIYRMASQAEAQAAAPVKAETVSYQAAAAAPQATVTVQPGDTVYALSRRYGVKPAEIIRANGLAAPFALSIGQEVIIPGVDESAGAMPVASAPAPKPALIEGAANIAAEMQTNLAKKAPSSAAPEIVTVSAPAPAPAETLRHDVSYADETLGATLHVVEPGNTLYSISRFYGIDVTEIAAANGLAAPYTLSVGQELLIPGSATGASASLSANMPAATPAPASAEVRPITPVYEAPTAAAEETRRETAYSIPSAGRTSEDSRFAWPLQGQVILAFGIADDGRRNDGINIAAPVGTPIRAVDDGEVVYRGAELEGYGNLLLIKHSDGWVSAYAHTDAILVKKGDRIRKGQIIAKVGTTGSVDQPQLHFELRHELKPTDPIAALDGSNALAARVRYEQD